MKGQFGQRVCLTNLRPRGSTNENLRATIRYDNITYNGVIHCHMTNKKAKHATQIISFLIHIMNSSDLNYFEF